MPKLPDSGLLSQIAQGFSAAAGPSKLIGGMAIFGGGIFTASGLQQTSMPMVGSSMSREEVENLRQAGGISGTWSRLKAVAAVGAMHGAFGKSQSLTQSLLSGTGGAWKGTTEYVTSRGADLFKATQELPGVKTAATIGGISGVLLGGLVGLKFGGLKRATSGAIIGGLLGGVAAGTGMAKVDLAVSRTVIQARKNVLSKGRAARMSNRVKSGGPGYRLWANRMRGAVPMGKPGHLGMNGALPFAMHKARNRSTV